MVKLKSMCCSAEVAVADLHRVVCGRTRSSVDGHCMHMKLTGACIVQKRRLPDDASLTGSLTRNVKRPIDI